MSKIVCVDFDDTIVPWDDVYANIEPFPGVISAMQQLRFRGYKIVILTSRMSSFWWKSAYKKHGYNSPEEFGESQWVHIAAFLMNWAIPFDTITAEKYPALVYFDDKAVRVKEGFPLSLAVATFLSVDHTDEWGGEWNE